LSGDNAAAAGIGGIIGVLATIVVAMIGEGGVIDRFYYPIVEVALNDTNVEVNDAERWKVTVTLTNYGSKPANNLALFIKAPFDNKFTDITNEFSTANVTVRILTDNSWKVLGIEQTIPVSELGSTGTYLELYMKKLNQGTGSKAVLDLGVQNDPQLDHFDVSAVYDEGSVESVKAGAWTYKGFVDTITTNESVRILIIVAAIIAIILAVLWRTRNRAFKGIALILAAAAVTIVAWLAIGELSTIPENVRIIIVAAIIAIILAVLRAIWKLNWMKKNVKKLDANPMWIAFFAMLTAALLLVSVVLYVATSKY
jgi:hypothetical protein